MSDDIKAPTDEMDELDDIEELEFDFDDEEGYQELFSREQTVGPRDHFAGIALAAILEANEKKLEETEDIAEGALGWSRHAYIIADAMMFARDEDLYESDDDEEDDEEDGDEGDDDESEKNDD